MDWQAALQKIDAAKLSAGARAPTSQTFSRRFAPILTQLDTDATAVAALMPMLPFATTLIDLSEARIRLEDVDSRKAAGQLTAVTQTDRRHARATRKRAGDGARPDEGARDAGEPTRSTACAPASRPGSTSTTATTRCSPGGWACRTSSWTRRCRTTRCSCATMSAPAGASPARRRRLRRSRRPPAPAIAEVPGSRRSSSRCRRTR